MSLVAPDTGGRGQKTATARALGPGVLIVDREFVAGEAAMRRHTVPQQGSRRTPTRRERGKLVQRPGPRHLAGSARPAGSTRYATLPEATQALTGRVDIIPVLPLSQGEAGNVRETFVARLLDGAGVEMAPPRAPTTRDEHAQRSTSGGMPVALRRPPGRSRWFSSYLNLVIDKDVLDISRVRQCEMLPRLLRQLAARSGQVLNMAAISGTIGLEKSTT